MPPAVPGSHDDPGVMGINYRAEPMRERLKRDGDPAYILSSFVHGDPATPVLETYPGDELMIRLIDGAHEEQHVFSVTGMSWRKEVADDKSPLAASQTIGVSEAFNLNVKEPYQAGIICIILAGPMMYGSASGESFVLMINIRNA